MVRSYVGLDQKDQRTTCGRTELAETKAWAGEETKKASKGQNLGLRLREKRDYERATAVIREINRYLKRDLRVF